MWCQYSKLCHQKVVAQRLNHSIDEGLNLKIHIKVFETNQAQNHIENPIKNIKEDKNYQNKDISPRCSLL